MFLDIKSSTIVTAIKDSLIRIQLSLNDLRAQAYGGASNMLGKIADEQPKALSSHCQGHSLNLRIKTTMANSKQMKDVMKTVI